MKTEIESKEFKVIALVKFNSGVAVVLNRYPEYVYDKHATCLIGVDGLFCNSYFYESPKKNWEAFAGRKFTVQLSNGEIENCSGQWWDGINAEARLFLGFDPVRITISTVNHLKDCYVFYGSYANKTEYQKLLSEYKGPVYDYYDYEAMIKGKKNPYRGETNFIRKYKRKRFTSKFIKTKS